MTTPTFPSSAASSRPSTEARGEVRRLLERLKVADLRLNVVSDGVVRQMQRRLDRKPVLRRDFIADVLRQWPISSGPFVVRRDVLREPFCIKEVRLSAGAWHRPSWVGWEQGATLAATLLTSEHGGAFFVDTLSHIGAHALARWYERFTGATDAALLDEMRELLAVPWPDVVGAEFPGRTPRGEWRGVLARARDGDGVVRRAVNVRTFLSAESIPDRDDAKDVVAA